MFDAVLAELEAVTVVEVKHDLGIFPAEALCIFNSTLGHEAEQDGVGIIACTFGNLKDYG